MKTFLIALVFAIMIFNICRSDDYVVLCIYQHNEKIWEKLIKCFTEITNSNDIFAAATKKLLDCYSVTSVKDLFNAFCSPDNNQNSNLAACYITFDSSIDQNLLHGEMKKCIGKN